MGRSCRALPSVVLLRGAKLEVLKDPINVDETLCRGGLSFQGPNHCSPAVDNEVETSEMDDCFEGSNDVMIGHPELGEEDVENM
jgi:hypothetical protein